MLQAALTARSLPARAACRHPGTPAPVPSGPASVLRSTARISLPALPAPRFFPAPAKLAQHGGQQNPRPAPSSSRSCGIAHQQTLQAARLRVETGQAIEFFLDGFPLRQREQQQTLAGVGGHYDATRQPAPCSASRYLDGTASRPLLSRLSVATPRNMTSLFLHCAEEISHFPPQFTTSTHYR